MENLKHTATKSLGNQPLGVLYLSNSEFNNVPNFNFNQYYPRIVDEALDQLSINSFYIVPIPIEVDISNPTSNLDQIKTKLEEYDYITYFVCSFETTYIDVVFEAYFRYNHSKILATTNSSQIGANYSDNVIRFLPNDYPTVNFWSNLYLKNAQAFDIIFLNGEFINTAQTLGYDAVKSDLVIITEFLTSVGKTMEPNPYDPSAPITGLPSIVTDPTIGPQLDNPNGITGDDVINSIINTLDSTVNPDYYTKNYYSSIKIQMAQNPLDESTYPDYLKVMLAEFLKDYPYPETINWKAVVSYVENIQIINGELFYDVDPIKLGYLPYLLYYLTFFDYTKNKDILLVLTQYQFPAILSAVNYYIPILSEVFGKPELLDNVKTKVRFILGNLNNLDEFNYNLFTDSRTDLIWQYDTGMTWYDILQEYTVRTVIPRAEQSNLALYDKLSQTMNLTINGQYYDFGKTNQPIIGALYNSLNFLFHFVKNGVQVSDFILSYFLNTKLLNFGNNLIFNQYMDNMYDIVVDTTYFYGGSTIVTRNLKKSLGSNEVFSTMLADNPTLVAQYSQQELASLQESYSAQVNPSTICNYNTGNNITITTSEGLTLVLTFISPCLAYNRGGIVATPGSKVCILGYAYDTSIFIAYSKLGYYNWFCPDTSANQN